MSKSFVLHSAFRPSGDQPEAIRRLEEGLEDGLAHQTLLGVTGSGKTFTIAALYLRLLLGLGGSAAFPRPLTVEELLVVTFTEAATEELRGRIRSNIHELRIACLRETTDNPLYARLLDEIADKKQAAQWLLLAERQMDEAAVFTIHGFCQRMLSLNAFGSASR